MTPQLEVALLRALYGGVLTGIVTGGTAFGTTRDAWGSLAVGLVAMATYILARGVVEGTTDSARAANGDVQPSDAQPRSPTEGAP